MSDVIGVPVQTCTSKSSSIEISSSTVAVGVQRYQTVDAAPYDWIGSPGSVDITQLLAWTVVSKPLRPIASATSSLVGCDHGCQSSVTVSPGLPLSHASWSE